MARSNRSNFAKGKVWTDRSISEIEGTIAGVSFMLFQCIPSEERQAAFEAIQNEHLRILDIEARQLAAREVTQ